MRAFGTFITGARSAQTYQSQSSRGIYGAGVASNGFVRYLLRYGDFDQFHFFASNRLGFDADGEAEEYLDLREPDPRVQLMPLREFPRAVQETNYIAFHSPWGPRVGPWVYLRNRFCKHTNVPITGVTHTISYHSLLPDMLVYLLNHPQPWDSIVCLEQPARKVMARLLTHLTRSMQTEHACQLAYKGRLDTIPLGVDPEVYRPRDRRFCRQTLGLPEDRIIVFWVGRFSHFDKADLRPLLLAFRLLRQECREQRPLLVLAGEDSRHGYADQVSSLAAQLEISGSVLTLKDPPLIDVPMLYSAADLFVTPSDNIQETFGQTVLEAMASGLPVVCSDWDGFSISVIHGETGYRVPTYWMECDQELCDLAPQSPWWLDHLRLGQSVCVDVPHLARALSLLIRHSELRNSMGVQARRHILATYDWKIIIGQYVELWNELHRIAQSYPPVQESHESWYRPSYFKTFQHYATAVLGDSTRVRITGESQLSEDSALSGKSYEEFRHTLRPDVLVHLRRLCDQSTTIGDLEQQISNITGVSTREFRSHLLWLLKHNELSIEIESVGEQVEGLTQALAREQECNDPVEFEELPATGVL
jgi:D-inositol-3-phosphate glycosyltransferase